MELKLKHNKKNHLVKIRRCCVKVDRLLPSTIQTYSKRKPIKKRKGIWIETKPNCNFSRRSERVFIKDSLINTVLIKKWKGVWIETKPDSKDIFCLIENERVGIASKMDGLYFLECLPYVQN